MRLRTPVHAIGGLIGMLEKTNLDEEQKTLISELKNTSTGMNNLIDNVIDFKKIESDAMEAERRSLSMCMSCCRPWWICSGLRPKRTMLPSVMR
ncbi:MAG: histidine kinase dimerization/phospho-acceptor domain-containing protein [Bacteroidales bacterium]|nr:histidine kinase dimerization/phospho-acceptor domain-containing protein [Bacteroidales bacterium]